MSPALAAALIALLLWWTSTGAILIVVRLAGRRGLSAGHRATLFSLPILAFGAWGYLTSLSMDTVTGAYLGFVSILALWGWVELAFLTGTITGPNAHHCPPDRPEWERFVRAWGTVAYHEMLLTALLIFVLLAGWEAENTFGMWAYAILYFARISAKLNLFWGVPHMNLEFMPAHLAHLPSHFRQARMNWLFPVAVTALTFALACWLERLWAAPDAASQAGFGLLSALTALALLEHWLMVLPLPDAKLWRWMLPAPETQDEKTRQETPHGV